jgi:hypothetical protein
MKNQTTRAAVQSRFTALVDRPELGGYPPEMFYTSLVIISWMSVFVIIIGVAMAIWVL